jgi:hypothetical protein
MDDLDKKYEDMITQYKSTESKNYEGGYHFKSTEKN